MATDLVVKIFNFLQPKIVTILLCLFKIDALRPSQQTLPPYYGTFTQNEDVMTSNKCLKYNHPTKPQMSYTYEWFDLNHFSWARLRPERLTSNQIISQ